MISLRGGCGLEMTSCTVRGQETAFAVLGAVQCAGSRGFIMPVALLGGLYSSVSARHAWCELCVRHVQQLFLLFLLPPPVTPVRGNGLFELQMGVSNHCVRGTVF